MILRLYVSDSTVYASIDSAQPVAVPLDADRIHSVTAIYADRIITLALAFRGSAWLAAAIFTSDVGAGRREALADYIAADLPDGPISIEYTLSDAESRIASLGAIGAA